MLDQSGQSLAATSTVLAPEARTSMFVTQHFAGAITSDFKGAVLIEAVNGRFAVVALELGAQPGQFTTLPVSAVR